MAMSWVPRKRLCARESQAPSMPLTQPVGVLCTWSTTFYDRETRISPCLDERMPPLPWRVMGFMMASFIVGHASRPCPLAQWPLAVEGVGSLRQPQDLPLIRRHISPYNPPPLIAVPSDAVLSCTHHHTPTETLDGQTTQLLRRRLSVFHRALCLHSSHGWLAWTRNTTLKVFLSIRPDRKIWPCRTSTVAQSQWELTFTPPLKAVTMTPKESVKVARHEAPVLDAEQPNVQALHCQCLFARQKDQGESSQVLLFRTSRRSRPFACCVR